MITPHQQEIDKFEEQEMGKSRCEVKRNTNSSLFRDRNKARVNNKILFIDNPYLFLTTRFV